ncbi:MAG: alpha/beta fold hydrolase [Actinobacteria bacterium]|nr:alpha/beta fold hydrolase [Actinomycetota bacterium]
MSRTCPPSFNEVSMDLAFDGWKAAIDGTFGYFSAVVSDRRLPWEVASDLTKWVVAMSDRKPPEWHTPHSICLEDSVARLRDFSVAGPDRGIAPGLVLPPQAGHDSCIVDYSPNQSQMRTVLESGMNRAYSLDWIGADAGNRDASIDDYLLSIDRAIDHIGEPVNLIGDCQGGWLATIYAALNPARVRSLTIAGAPIDFHGGEPIIHSALQALTPGGDLGFYRSLVASGGGVLKGEYMLGSFIMMQPDSEIGRQSELLLNVGDSSYVANYSHFEDWFKHTQDIPGEFYLWIVEHLFANNELLSGKLTIGGETVDLARIECPVNLIAGAKDHITPPAQVFALAEAVSTPADQVKQTLTTGGHLGLFMGREALSEHWAPMLGELASSQADQAVKAS